MVLPHSVKEHIWGFQKLDEIDNIGIRGCTTENQKLQQQDVTSSAD